MANTTYITSEGERWDNIAFKAYGSVTGDGIRAIMDANPYESTKEFFKAGVTLIIPIIESENVDTTTNLPPWKR